MTDFPTPDDEATTSTAPQGIPPTPYAPYQVNLPSLDANIKGGGTYTSLKRDENRMAVSLLIALDHRRTGLPVNEIALKYGLTAPAAAMALSQSMNEMADALGSYRLTLDTPLPVTGPSPVRKRKGKRP